MKNLFPSGSSRLVCDREIQLRREIVATMRLRTAWRNAACRQVTLNRASTGNPRPPGANLPHPTFGYLGDRGVDSGERTTRILLISDYDGLRLSCERLLRKHGYHVDSMNSHRCLAIQEIPPFDIAVLCQSVQCDLVPVLSHVLRDRNPACCLLRVASLLSGIESGFDLRVDGFGGPAAFLAALDSLAHAPRQSA